MNRQRSHTLAVLLFVCLSSSISLHAGDTVSYSDSNFPAGNFLSLDIPGLKVGLASDVEDFSGLQLGLVVHADNPCGMQFGLFVAAAEAFQGWQHGNCLAFTGTPCSNMSKLTLDSPPQTSRSHGFQTSFFGGFADCIGGVQLSLVGATAWEICGLQMAIGQTEAKIAEGLQISLHTVASDLNGLQIGIYNEAESLHGIQVGLLNLARAGSGIQIGLVNGFGSDDGTRWLPLLNARF